MNIMSAPSTLAHAAPRRSLRGGVVASLVAVAAMLAGCSSSADSGMADSEYLAPAGEEAYAEAPLAGAARDASSETAQASTIDRSVIITGAMYMTVEDPIVAADRAAGIVRSAGGRIDARSETAPDENYGGSAALTLRIPSDRLDAAVDDLRKLGTVDQYSTDSYDVTVEVTDLEAQISTLRASTKRIEGLLLDAKDISDIITLENELSGRQAQLQSLEARQRGLDDQVSMSTIDLSLTTEPVVIVEEDGPETFWDALGSGWNALVAFLSGVAIVVGVLLPWIALIALIALPAFFAVRARKSRTARRAVAEQPALAVPTQPAPKAATSRKS